MRKNICKTVTLSAMLALFAACSDSSSNSTAPSASVVPDEQLESSDSTDEAESSSSVENISKGDADLSSSAQDAVNSSSSEDDPTSSADEELSSSSEKTSGDTDSSSSNETVTESSSSDKDVSSSSEEVAPTLSEACVEMRSTQDKFIPLENVFDCVLPNEKMVFVIRHGERWKDASGDTGDLNEHGKSQSSYLGSKLAKKTEEDFYYISTKTYRTISTNIFISKGKGETVLDSMAVFSKESSNHYSKNQDFTSNWFIKGSKGKCGEVGSWPRFTMFAYDKTACPDEFYDVDEKTKEIIDKHFMYEDIPYVTVVSTHDNFLAPFLISLTDRKIGLEAHKYVYPNNQYNDWNQNVFKHWPNYLAGVAIIVNENNERAFVPVKGLNTGYLGEHCVNGTEEGYTCTMWEKDVQ